MTNDARWMRAVAEASLLGDIEPEAAVAPLLHAIKEMQSLSPHALAANDGTLQRLLNSALYELVGIYSVLERYAQAYALLIEYGPFGDELTGPDFVTDRAYLLHHMGRPDEAGALVATVLTDTIDIEFIRTGERFFMLLRYGHFARAQAWLDTARDPVSAHSSWHIPEAVGMLHYFEAFLRAEQAQYERALVSYDKAHRMIPDAIPQFQLAQDFITAGRPNLAARILANYTDSAENRLWYAIALRALGRSVDADSELAVIADMGFEGDAYLEFCALTAICLLNTADEELLETIRDDYDNEDFMRQPLAFAYALIAAQIAEDETEYLSALESARNEARKALDGAKLSRTDWYIAQLILTPDQLARCSHLFDPTLMPPRFV